MAKIRVYQLAKEIGLSNADLVEKLKSLGFDIKNHMSTLSESETEQIRSEVSQKEEIKIDEVRIKPNIIRRRKKVVEQKAPPPEEPPPEIEPIAAETAEPPAIEQKDIVIPESPATETPKTQGEPPVGPGPVAPPPVIEPPPSIEPPIAIKADVSGKKVAEEASKKKPETPKPRVTKGKKTVTPDAKQDLEPEKKKKIPVAAKPDGEKVPFPKKKRGARKKTVEYNLEKGEEAGPQTYPAKKAPFSAKRRVDFRKDKKFSKRQHQKPTITIPKASKRKVRMGETITVGELAKQLSIKAAEIIRKLMQNGVMVNINQTIDLDTATLISNEYEYEIESTIQNESTFLPEEIDVSAGEIERPPVVTIMGHVNHGKTRLLDTIRTTNVMDAEAGGITQHIGAYTVQAGDNIITFLDTPGHEAFTKIRARGANATDIVILVVAADDGVMPQTVEAINHAKAAKVPIIVAINKIDLDNANIDRVKQGLADYGLMPEDWGGENLFALVSAKEGTGIPELLDLILLQAEMQEIKANPNTMAKGLIVEARLDRTLGTIATVLVQEGTLNIGDAFVTGHYHGKIRVLIDDKGHKVDKAGPSIPVEVIGCSGVPEAGEALIVVEDEKKAKSLSALRIEKSRQEESATQGKMSLEDLYERMRQEELKEFNLILKADVQGSLEALAESLERLSNEEVKIKILHSGVGGINETDVMLASASNALIIGFNVRAEAKALTLSEQEKVDIQFYDVIYTAISDVNAALHGMLKPVYKEVLLGHAEVRDTFSVHRVGTIAGSYIIDGKMERNAKARILRNSLVIFDGKIASLRRFKDDVKEVMAGYECGIRLENYNDIKTGDVVESYFLEIVPYQVGEKISEKVSS